MHLPRKFSNGMHYQFRENFGTIGNNAKHTEKGQIALKILFIGNSYTYYNDIPEIFAALARENGLAAEVVSVTKGGRKLYENLDPADENGQRIREACREGGWDVLVLQEQSVLPLKDSAAFHRGLQGLAELVQAKRTRLYATWGRKEGCPLLDELGMTSVQMTKELEEAYETAAAMLGAELAPVGSCFRELRRLQPKLELYDPDLSHPSYAGSCMSAVCHFAGIFGRLPASCTTLALEQDQVQAILEAAKKVLF